MKVPGSVLAALAVGFVGCNRAVPPPAAAVSGPPRYVMPTGPAPKVELSEPVVTQVNSGTVRCAFKYHFREGQPAAGSWYCCLVEFAGCPGSYRRPIAAEELQADGTLEQEIRLLAPGATAFQITFADAVAKAGPYRPVSNALVGPVAKPLPRVTDFALPDTKGQKHTVAEWQGQKAIVLIFLGTECPVSNGYAPEYVRLAKAFADKGVRFYGVHPDPDVTAKAAAEHAQAYHLTFPILLDPTQVVAKQAGVQVTPEAVVLMPGGQVVYRGRIDDRYTLDGKRKDVATTKDLEAALTAVVAGTKPPVAETAAYGCPLPPVK